MNDLRRHDNENGEKRKDLRVPIRVMQIKMEGGTKVFFGYADNLSTSGLFIQTINPKAAGTRFSIEFILPGSQQKIECQVEVMWKRDFVPGSHFKPGMGLRFIDLDSDFLSLLRQFIEQAGPTFHPAKSS